MIFDDIKNSSRYHGLHENLKAGLAYLTEVDPDSLQPGRIDLDGERLYVLVQEFATRQVTEAKWEAHRKYIDIQYVVSGCERMGFAHLNTMVTGEYLEERDFLAVRGTGNFVDVPAGMFVVFFPEDAHMPCLCVDAPAPVKKIVLKVRI